MRRKKFAALYCTICATPLALMLAMGGANVFVIIALFVFAALVAALFSI